jgi:hypothetical protein
MKRAPRQRVFAPAARRSLLVAAALVIPASVIAAASESDEQKVLSGSHSEQRFIAGEKVRVEAAVDDDIFAAGWEVIFDGASARNMIAAGHALTFSISPARWPTTWSPPSAPSALSLPSGCTCVPKP